MRRNGRQIRVGAVSSPLGGTLRRESGLALVSALLLVLLSFTLGAATLFYTLLDNKATQHFVTGNQAFAAAEAGMINVVSTINHVGIVNFQNEVAGKLLTSGSSTIISASGSPTVKYAIGTISGTSSTTGTIQITGSAPLEAERILTTTLRRGGFGGGAGALHLALDTVTTGFSGTSFTIDGRNHADNGTAQLPGTLDPTKPTRPAISTRNDSVRDFIQTTWSSGQDQGAIGLTTGPLGWGTNSVWTTSSASVSEIQNIASSIIAATPNGGLKRIPKDQGNISNSNRFGTKNNPAVTIIEGDSPSLSGNLDGYGILIVENSLKISGNINWYGWIILKNPSAPMITIDGGITVHGMVWTTTNGYQGNGNFLIDYCYDCLLNYADKAGGNPGLMPAPVTVALWNG